MGKVSLVKAKANHRGKVLEILGGAGLEHKLMNMGVFKGKKVIKLNHVGLKGPVVVKVGRSILALGHNIASKVIVGVE